MSKKIASLTSFINRRISIIYLIVLIISVPLIYFISVAQLEKEATAELDELMLTLKRMTPKLFQSQIADEPSAEFGISKLLQLHEGYFYNYVDANAIPTNTEFSGHNQQLLRQFQADAALTSLSGAITKDNLQLVYQAFPITTLGELDGFVMFGISLDKFSNIVIVRVVTFIGMMTILYAIIISSINTTLRNHVINPLLRINNRTKAVANGEIDKVFESKRNDEVGELIKSIELLRRSLSISMNMHKKN